MLYKVVDPKTLCGFHQGWIKYEIGKEALAPDWANIDSIECGKGLHLCLTPLGTRKFGKGKILKCLVDLNDISVYPKSIEKVRCRAVTPIAEVDIRGNEIKG